MKEHAHNQKECPAQGSRTTFGDAPAADIHLARLVRWSVNAGKCHESFLGIKTPHIANFSHELRTKCRPNTKHSHDNWVLRQTFCKGLHFLFQRCQSSRDRPQLRNSLSHQQLCGVGLRHNPEMATGRGVDIQSLFLAEIVAMLLAPFLVLGDKGFRRKAADTLTVPESIHKIHPFLAAIRTGGTGKQTIGVRKSGIQQGNQIVLEHGLYLGILLVLPVAVFQHQPGIFLRNISRQREPVVKAVVGQLYGIFLVGLGSS